jgi:hypothetical protein
VSTEWKFGASKLWFEEPDVVRMEVHGETTLKLMREMSVLVNEFKATRPRIYLIADVRQNTGIAPDARKGMSEDASLMPYTATVMFGGSFAMRTMTNMLSRAMKLLGTGPDSPYIFVDTEDEAKAWVAQQRAADAAKDS